MKGTDREPQSEAGRERALQAEWQGYTGKDKLLLAGKGMAMGLGDSVPGVSGGTIAVITGIYDTLIYSIRSIDLRALGLARRLRLAEAWAHINGSFLLLLAMGVLAGLVISASTVLFLLDNYFEVLMAFFIGLVLASTWILRREFRWRHPANLALLVLGLMFTAAFSFLEPMSGAESLVYFFFCGAIAICAMILPGLSGAFILLLLGAYEPVLTALINIDLAVIAVFATGCAVGLLSFSRLLAWLLSHYHELCYGFISGMLLGSLLVLWPWQMITESYVDSDGELHALRTVNLLPGNYAELSGNEPMLALAVLAAILGFALVIGLERLFGRH